MLKKILRIIVLLVGISVSAQDTFNTMFYNVLFFPSALPGGRDQILQNILNQYEPDLFMICELESSQGADLILSTSLNDEGNRYSRASFVPNSSGDSDLQQLIFYKTEVFSLENAEVIQTSVRDINHYQLKLNTADQQSDPVYLEVFVTHLKSSQGAENRQLRLDMVTEFTNKLATLDPNSYVIFAGDFNVYNATEPAYQKILDPNNAIVMVDPINTPGSWNNNIAFQNVHTQSTRISSGPFGAGAGGGLDDRFDFIMISENMMSNPVMRYVPETYKAFGNNGNCYNNNISDSDCSGEYSQSLRNSLYSMSDHLPVVMQLETEKDILLSQTEFDTPNTTVRLAQTIVTETLELQILSQRTQRSHFEIYNVLSQKIMTITSENSENLIVDVSRLADGVYYITSNFPINTLKFLKTT